jgi:hypothetical protein
MCRYIRKIFNSSIITLVFFLGNSLHAQNFQINRHTGAVLSTTYGRANPLFETRDIFNEGHTIIQKRSKQFYGIDTCIVYTQLDTSRYSYVYDANFRILSKTIEPWEKGKWNNYWINNYSYDLAENTKTIIVTKWNGENWNITGRVITKYNKNGLMISLFDQEWNNDQWINSSRFTNQYDSEGRLITSLLEEWKDDQWMNINKTTNSYSNKGLKLSSLYEQWSWTTGLIDYTERQSFAYDSLDHMVLQILKILINEVWTNRYRNTYSYDAYENVITWTRGPWENDNWVDGYRTIYAYDSSNRLITELQSNWFNSSWVTLTRTTINYNATGNLISQLKEQYSNEQWVNLWQYLYSYDANNYILELNFNYWNNNTWLPGQGTFSFTDSTDNVQYFNSISRIVFHTIQSITNIKSDKVKVPSGYQLYQNYPNPFNPSTIIAYDIPIDGKVTIKIYDALGREVLTLVNKYQKAGDYSVVFNGNNLSSGVYYYKIKSNEYTFTKKMILLQ